LDQIEGVQIIPLKVIKDERGAVKHMIRSTDPYFKQFGEIYFSVTNPGVVKGWKLHKEVFQHMVCPEGQIQMVFYDSRENSKTFKKIQSITFGEENYSLIIVPPNIWYSFKAVSKTHAMIANCITLPHNPTESITCDLNSDSIPFKWN
jgi:dTDP-4-dehydrorhamnose 3,5-epimerase